MGPNRRYRLRRMLHVEHQRMMSDGWTAAAEKTAEDGFSEPQISVPLSLGQDRWVSSIVPPYAELHQLKSFHPCRKKAHELRWLRQLSEYGNREWHKSVDCDSSKLNFSERKSAGRHFQTSSPCEWLCADRLPIHLNPKQSTAA